MAKKKVLKGKNKFIRLEPDNLRFIIKRAKEENRSQNWLINACIEQARVISNDRYSK